MSAKIKAVPEGFHAVTPCLTLKNSVEAIGFYKKAFGAKVLDIYPSPDGKRTMHAVMQIGNSILMMGDENPGQNCRSAESIGASPVGLFLYVPDAAAVFKQAVAAGATIIAPVTDMFWGDRCGTLKDPFGYTWMVATHTRDLTRKEIEEGARSFAAQAGKP
ncbi:MAG: VOC family protein [Kiritimatiellales bacterium]|jgi:uncharacterized glyoxalase superfamily protein PhnB